MPLNVHEDVATAIIGFLDPIALLAVSSFGPGDWEEVRKAIHDVVHSISTQKAPKQLQSLSWDIPGISDAPPSESIVFGGPMRDNERKFIRLMGKEVFESTGGEVEIPVTSLGSVDGVARFSVAAYKSGDISIPAWVILCADDESDVVQWIHDHKSEDDIPGEIDWEDSPDMFYWYGKGVDDESYTSDEYMDVRIQDFDELTEEAKTLFDVTWEDDEDES